MKRKIIYQSRFSIHVCKGTKFGPTYLYQTLKHKTIVQESKDPCDL